MSFRYKTTFPSDDDIADPSDWVDSNAELAGEFNGGMDRDNLPESAVDGTHISDGTVAEVFSDPLFTASVNLPTKTTEWVDGDGTTVIGRVAPTIDVDSVLDIVWSGTWNWNIGGGYPLAGESELLAIRLVVDGVEVARSPVHSDSRDYDSTTLYGNTVVGPGSPVVTVEFRTYRASGNGRAERTVSIDYGELIVEVLKR